MAVLPYLILLIPFAWIAWMVLARLLVIDLRIEREGKMSKEKLLYGIIGIC